MAKGDHSFRKQPKGSKLGGYARPRIQVGFDKVQWSMIVKLAKISNRSIPAEVRELVNFAIKARMPLIAPPSREEQNYLDKIEAASSGYDPNVIIGGPH